ncbi:MAG: DUF1564 family protein [Leptospiraceae bacterium]|nr:DUF1564 family protein [Leptospiraceae bacterium]
MKVFYTPTFYNECKNLNEEQHNSSLLIPKDLIDFWNERTGDDEDSRRDYLHLLIKKYRFLVYTGILEKSETLMTKYQEKDQRLRKVAIRPYPEDWAELKQLKAFFNKSICFIVTFLVMLDSLGVAESIPEHLSSFGVPMQTQFRLYTRAILSRKNVFYERQMQYRRDKYHKKI